MPVSVAESDWYKHITSRQHQRYVNYLISDLILTCHRAIFVLKGGRQAVKERQMAQRDAVRAEREKLRYGAINEETQV